MTSSYAAFSFIGMSVGSLALVAGDLHVSRVIRGIM